MSYKSDEIREIAEQLKYLSVSNNADSSSYITRADLEHFRDCIVSAILNIADVLES